MQSSYKHRAGDRKDGRLLRTLPSFNNFIPFVMPQKNDACNQYEESFEISAVDKCLRQERVNGYKDISFLHFMIAAYVRCVSMLPGLNRFVAGRRIYARNSITVVLAVRRSLSVESADAVVKVEFEPTDTIFDVYRKINLKIDEIKSGIENNNTEEIADTLSRFPRPILRAVLGVLRMMDYFGWLPQGLTNSSPYHGTVCIKDMGALRVGPVYHHVYNFGNLPVYITFGAKRRAYEINKDGEVLSKKYLDTRFVFDERIVDGHYYAQFLQALRYIFAHPQILERSPSRIVEDVG